MPNIIVKDKNGNDVVYYGIKTVTFDCDDGTQAVFAFNGSTEGTTTAAVDETANLVLSNARIDDDGNLVLTAKVDEDGILTI